MDPPYSLWITIFAVLISLILFSTLNYKKKYHKNLPPGPMKLPFIGNLHNVIGKLPHRTLERLSQKYGPLMHLQLGEASMLVVSSAEIAKQLLKTEDLSFAQRPKVLAVEVSFGISYPSIPFVPYGEYWRQMRKLSMVELLSNTRVQSFSSIREEELESLVQSIKSSPDQPINLTDLLLRSMSMILSRAAFGRKYDREGAAKLGSKFKQTLLLMKLGLADLYPSVKFLRVGSPSFARMKNLFKYIDGAIQNIIDNHVSETRSDSEIEDLVDVLLRLQKNGELDVPLTTNCIKAFIADMFGAGTESTSKIVEWAMAEMMKHPNVMLKAQAEIRQGLKGKKMIKEADIQGLSYLKLVVKETLRLHPPVTLLPRECREPCIVEGYEISAKTSVLINAWAIGRDLKYWHDGESFYPERFMNTSIDFKGRHFEFLAFGAGRRMCPGLNLGLASVEFALAQLLYHFDWNHPDQMKQQNLDMTERFGAAVGRKFDLRLIAVPFMPVQE